MDFIKISVPSAFGWETNSLLVTQGENTRRLAVLFPGGFNTYESPVLYYANRIAMQHGSNVLNIEYGYRRAGLAFSSECFEPSVTEAMASLQLCGIEKYNEITFISKSFGTLVAGETAKRLSLTVRHFFLTPVEATLVYINEAACTVAYGTNDPHFSAENAARIKRDPHIHMIVFPNADHMLENADEYTISLKNLSALCEAYNKLFINKEE